MLSSPNKASFSATSRSQSLVCNSQTRPSRPELAKKAEPDPPKLFRLLLKNQKPKMQAVV